MLQLLWLNFSIWRCYQTNWKKQSKQHQNPQWNKKSGKKAVIPFLLKANKQANPDFYCEQHICYQAVDQGRWWGNKWNVVKKNHPQKPRKHFLCGIALQMDQHLVPKNKRLTNLHPTRLPWNLLFPQGNSDGILYIGWHFRPFSSPDSHFRA